MNSGKGKAFSVDGCKILNNDFTRRIADYPSFRRTPITASFTRRVDVSMNIEGPLPNAFFTLPMWMMVSATIRADLSLKSMVGMSMICRKASNAWSEYTCEAKEVKTAKMTLTLSSGRVYTRGDNRWGQCGQGSEEAKIPAMHHVRLPPVARLWVSDSGVAALTARGDVYVWGGNLLYRFGGDLPVHVLAPTRITLPGVDGAAPVVQSISLLSFQMMVLISGLGWVGCGNNQAGQLGQGHTDPVDTFIPIIGSDGVSLWDRRGSTVYAWTPRALLVCGDNAKGQCGVGSTEENVTTLTPVALPDDVKGRVDRVVTAGGAAFFISDRRCFATGDNTEGRLGIASNDTSITHPIELPIPVDDIIVNTKTTIVKSGDDLYIAGQLGTATLTRLDTPAEFTRVVLNFGSILLQVGETEWVGKGIYNNSVYKSTLSNIARQSHRLTWNRVLTRMATQLTAMEAGPRSMEL